MSGCGGCGQYRRQSTLTTTELEAATAGLIDTLVGTGSGCNAVNHSVVKTRYDHLHLQAEVSQVTSCKFSQSRKVC